jgi:hypothetical protein
MGIKFAGPPEASSGGGAVAKDSNESGGKGKKWDPGMGVRFGYGS